MGAARSSNPQRFHCSRSAALHSSTLLYECVRFRLTCAQQRIHDKREICQSSQNCQVYVGMCSKAL